MNYWKDNQTLANLWKNIRKNYQNNDRSDGLNESHKNNPRSPITKQETICKTKEETRWKRITGSESANSGLKKVEGRMAFTPEVEERTDVAKGELRKLHIEL